MRNFSLFFLIFFSTTLKQVSGQVSISYPTTRSVFQRSNTNQTSLYIAGNYTSMVDRVEARAITRPMTPSQGNGVNWTIIQTNPSNGYFYGTLNLTGGWYDIEVKCWLGSILVGSASVQRIGVGEVFLIAGQSNATGDSYLASQGNYGPQANDDRVSVVNYNLSNITNYGSCNLPAAEFSHLDSTLNIAPFGTSAWCWGALGDTLVKRLNVPIAFFNAGASGSGLNSWNTTADDSTATPFNFITYPRGMPYGRFRAALNFYVAQFGVRAIFWHQGETDNLNETSRNTYGQQLKNIIAKSRLHSNKGNLAWVVSKASRFKGFSITNSRVWQPVIDAQNDVIGINGTGQANYTANVYEGPQTDMLLGPNIRTSDSIHFVGTGHRMLAKLWSQKLTNNFFSSVVPYLPTPPPNLTSLCNGAVSLTLSVPNVYANFNWTNNITWNNNLSNSNIYNASSGSYRIRVKDTVGNILLSPQINIPNNFAGLIPITSVSSGTWHDGNSWSCNRIPSSLDYVIINSGHNIIVGGGLTARFKKVTLIGNLQISLSSKLQN